MHKHYEIDYTPHNRQELELFKTAIAWLNSMSKISDCRRKSSFLFCVEFICNEKHKRVIGKESFVYICDIVFLMFFKHFKPESILTLSLAKCRHSLVSSRILRRDERKILCERLISRRCCIYIFNFWLCSIFCLAKRRSSSFQFLLNSPQSSIHPEEVG